MEKFTEDQEAAKPQKLHVLTEKEAWLLLEGSNSYFRRTEPIGGRHPAEIIAESAAREGTTSLAGSLMELHNDMKAFHRGDYSRVTLFTEVPVIDNLLDDARGTKFERAVNDIVRPLNSFTEVPGAIVDAGSRYDEERSAKVLAHVKQERFPEDMSMVEKLDKWQRDQTPGRQ